MIETVPQVNDSVASQDRIDATRTIYQASAGEIFWRQFLAGAGRALGTIVVYLLFLAMMFFFISRFVWPRVEPYFTTMMRSMELLESSQQETQQLLPLLNGGTVQTFDVAPNAGGTTEGSTSVQIDQLYQLLDQARPAATAAPAQ